MILLQNNMDDDVAECGKLLGLLDRNKIPKIEQFVELTVPRYTDANFRHHFTMSLETVDILIRMTGNCPEVPTEFHGNRGCPPIAVLEKQILCYLWYMRTLEPYDLVAERFGIAESVAFNVVKRVGPAVVNNFTQEFIKWPTGAAAAEVMANFKQKKGIPGVIGAIDGSHIPITAPSENQDEYINRKRFHSIVLQVVCDSDLTITDAYCGYPGRTHDARILRNSPLFDEISNNRDFYFPCNCHLLGDSAYPLLQWLLTPFRNHGNLTRRQKNYNFKHSSTCMSVEHCFGTLKGQFRRLMLELDVDVMSAPTIILAACILHNLSVLNHEEIEEWCNDDGDDDDDDNVVHNVFPPNVIGIQKRRQIMRMLR